jgi:hypothetical protein
VDAGRSYTVDACGAIRRLEDMDPWPAWPQGSKIRVRLRQKRANLICRGLSLFSLTPPRLSRFDPRFSCQLPIFLLPLVSVYQENQSNDSTTAVPQVHYDLRDPSFSDTNQPLPNNHYHLLMLWFHNHEEYPNPFIHSLQPFV